MKKNVLWLVVVAILITAAVSTAFKKKTPASEAGPEPITLSIVTWNASLDYMSDEYGLDWFLDECYAQSKGELIIDYKGGPEVVGVFEAFEAMKDGVVDIITTFPAVYEQYGPHEALIIDIVPSDDQGQLPTQELRDMMDEVHKQYGAYYLGRWADFYPFLFFLTKKVETLDDFKKLRLGSNGPNGLRAIEAFGATPVPLKLEEFHTALERGMVDGITFIPGPFISRGLTEVVDYVVAPPHNQIGNATMLVNLKVWNSLPSHLQEVMVNAMSDLKHDSKYYNMGRYKRDLDYLKSVGLETIELVKTPEQVKWWQSRYSIATWVKLQERLSPERYNELKGMLERAGYPEPEGL